MPPDGKANSCANPQIIHAQLFSGESLDPTIKAGKLDGLHEPSYELTFSLDGSKLQSVLVKGIMAFSKQEDRIYSFVAEASMANDYRTQGVVIETPDAAKMDFKVELKND